jgi:RNA polymerase sigma-70 factor (ECF subfamily)
VYDRYSRCVYRRARALLGSDDAAKDATQEVFLRVIRLSDPARFKANPVAWLYRVTTNLCLNNLRDARRRGAILSTWNPDALRSGDADARTMLRTILGAVPEELQEVAIYYYLDELSHEEIASIIGVSRRTVGNRLATFLTLTGELVHEASQ